MGQNFYIGDWHFGHTAVLKMDNRPWVTIEDMNRDLIQYCNDTVKHGDTLYIVGDISMKGGETLLNLVKQIKCDKVLIKGNHDKVSGELAKEFKGRVYEKLMVRDKGRKVVLCHQPMPCFDGHFNGDYHLYAHVHMTKEYELMEKVKAEILTWDVPCNMYNVGAMLPYMEYKPKTLDEIIIGYAIWDKVIPIHAGSGFKHEQKGNQDIDQMNKGIKVQQMGVDFIKSINWDKPMPYDDWYRLNELKFSNNELRKEIMSKCFPSAINIGSSVNFITFDLYGFHISVPTYLEQGIRINMDWYDKNAGCCNSFEDETPNQVLRSKRFLEVKDSGGSWFEQYRVLFPRAIYVNKVKAFIIWFNIAKLGWTKTHTEMVNSIEFWELSYVNQQVCACDRLKSQDERVRLLVNVVIPILTAWCPTLRGTNLDGSKLLDELIERVDW